MAIKAFYEERVLPGLIDKVCGIGPIHALRQEIVPQASGIVLEVGVGSGLNLPYYDADKVSLVYGLEPSEGMRRRAQQNLAAAPVPIEWLGLRGEEIPLDDNSVDTILLTFTLCTIPDYALALAQMHRVLKPGGKLLFCEHGLAPDADTSVQKWQHRVTPVWKQFAGGCHLNRPVTEMLRNAGFAVEHVDTQYLHGTPRIAGYVSMGVAS